MYTTYLLISLDQHKSKLLTMNIIGQKDIMLVMLMYLPSDNKRILRSVCKSSCNAVDSNVTSLIIRNEIMRKDALNKWTRIHKLTLIDINTLPSFQNITCLTTLILVSYLLHLRNLSLTYPLPFPYLFLAFAEKQETK